MKIWVSAEALAESSTEYLRQGALYGLRRFLDMNYELGREDGSLTEQQENLIRHEGIPFSGFPEEEADLRVLAENGKLVVRTPQERTAAAAGNWADLVREFLFPQRKTEVRRKTAETDITLSLNLDGTGVSRIDTGLKFFDHMLDQIAKHGLMDLELTCRGDLEIDEHHTIEDTAIALGEAIYKLCGEDKTGLQRYGFNLVMDEAQAEVALDLSNRPYFVWNVDFAREYIGDFPTDMAEHFFHSLAMNMRATLHIRAEGKNDHHKLESIFKGFSKALRFSVTRTERAQGILPSSKGKL